MKEFEHYKVVIAEPNDGMDDTFQILKDLGCEVVVGRPVSCADQVYSEDEIISMCKDADAFFGMSRETITRRVLENCPKMRVICKYGTGVNNIDCEAASELGIIVANAPVHNLTVAEFAIADMLAVLKKIPYSANYLRQGGWRDDTTTGHELFGKTVGIVGFGRIGKQVAKRLQNWGVNLVAYDPFVSREEASLFNVQMVDWETIFRVSDIITIHVNLTKETENLIGWQEFEWMKETAIFINAARGGLVDQEALIDALRTGKIAGAGIDVFVTEHLEPDYPLLQMDNVVLTPHTAGYTYESLYRIAQQATANCVSALRGIVPEFVANRDAVSRWKQRFGV